MVSRMWQPVACVSVGLWVCGWNSFIFIYQMRDRRLLVSASGNETFARLVHVSAQSCALSLAPVIKNIGVKLVSNFAHH